MPHATFLGGGDREIHQLCIGKALEKFGKPRHIGDRRKARDETSQTITFN